jgi:endonuclease/exonuclease/phosphatase (EEP) superfamily protein YafD
MLRSLSFQLSLLGVSAVALHVAYTTLTDWHIMALANSIRYVIWVDFLYAGVMLIALHKIKNRLLLKGALAFALPAVLFLGIFTVPALLTERLPSHPPLESDVRLMVMNVNAHLSQSAADVAEKTALVQKVSPDVLVVLESTPQIQRDIGNAYPYQHTVRGLKTHPTSVFSRYPLRARTVLDDSSPMYDVQTPQGTYTVIAAHPLPPVTPALWRERNQALATMSFYRSPHPLIIMGDFNTVPWDIHLQKVIEKQDLKMSHTLVGTWLSLIPAVPIDHILVPHTMPVRASGFAFAGKTDHLSLWADVTLSP